MTALIWTRSLADWDEDKTLLAGKTFEVIHLPTLKLVPLPVLVPRREYHGAIITSQKALAMAWEHQNLRELLKQMNAIHTFGEETAKALREKELPAIQYPVKSGEALAETLARLGARPRPYLVVGAKEPAYDIRGHLNKSGWQVDELAVYDNVAPAPLSPPERSVLLARCKGVVCLASPSAATGLETLFGDQFATFAAQCTAAVIGETTAKACRPHFKKIIVALQPNLKELVAAAEKGLREYKET